MKRQRHTNNFTATIGFYSQAMKADKFAFTSGELSLAPQKSPKEALIEAIAYINTNYHSK